jgi:hypothetical protein
VNCTIAPNTNALLLRWSYFTEKNNGYSSLAATQSVPALDPWPASLDCKSSITAARRRPHGCTAAKTPESHDIRRLRSSTK